MFQTVINILIIQYIYVFHSELGGVYMTPEWISFRWDTHSPLRFYISFTFTFTFEFLILEWNAVKTSVDRKHELTDQANQSTYLIPYLNDLVPP